jgi:hypothetical protein
MMELETIWMQLGQPGESVGEFLEGMVVPRMFEVVGNPP